MQAAYQRRSDLIPNLVATVQGYADQEKSVLTQVTQARAQATHVSIDASTITDPAAFAQIPGRRRTKLSGVLGHLLSITENYPDLKSNQNFLALQSQLEGTENRIEIARRDYNAAVQDYNTELVTIPGSLWAATMYKSLQAGHALRRQRRGADRAGGELQHLGPPAPSAAAAQPGTQPTKP